MPPDDHVYDLVISDGRVIDPDSGFDGMAHIGIDGGTITGIAIERLTGKKARGYRSPSWDLSENTLELLEANAYDMVISDIIMPGMGGIALAAIISERWPDSRILLTSGNIDGEQAGYPFLPKPVSPNGLAARVR